MRCTKGTATTIALVLATAAPGAFCAVQIVPGGTLTVLIPPSSDPDRFATTRAVNASGDVVGWFAAGAQSDAAPRGFFYSGSAVDGVTQRWPDDARYTWVQPYDIANRDRAGNTVKVGQARVTPNTTRYAFAGQDAAPQIAAPESEATAINQAGQIVGWRTINGSTQAFYYQSPGTPSALLSPFPAPSTLRQSRALGINDGGQIVGYYVNQSDAATDFRGFVYQNDANESNRTFTDLGPITVQEPAEADWRLSYDAVSINDNGQVAATQRTDGDLNHAVLFNGTTPRDLGVLTGYEESFAAGISNTGWVVGFLRDADLPLNEQKSGFLWASGTMLDVSTLGGEDFKITVVHDAYSAVDPENPFFQKGFIVGEGITPNGSTHAFVMDITVQVPEPHTYMLLGFGLLALATVRLRRLPPH